MNTPDKTTKAEIDGRVEVVRRPHSSLRWVIAILSVLIVAELGARLIERTDPGHIIWYNASAQLKVDMMDSREADVVFVGTSMAWQGFVPGEFSTANLSEGFNASLAGAVPVVMEPWILDQVEPRLEPSVVVWGLSSLDFAPDYGSQQLEAYSDAAATKEGVFAEIDRGARRVSALIRLRPLLRSPTDLFGGGADETEAEIAEATLITGANGERLKFGQEISLERQAIIQARLANFSPDQGDANAIGRTIEALAEKGVSVVLVQMPVPDRFIDAHPEGVEDYELTGLTIQQLGSNFGVDVIHMDELFPDSSFVDFTHLDQQAAEEFTRWFSLAMQARSDVAVGTCGDGRLTDDLGFPLVISICRNSAD